MNYKKLAGVTLASMLLLTGCQKKVDGKDVVASTSQKNILADDLYKKLSSTTNGKTALFSYVLDTLINQEYPATSAMKKNAEDMVSSYKNSYKNQYGDSYETQFESDLKNAGYKSVSDYKNKIIYSLQYSELMKKYVKANFNSVYNDYYSYASPRILSIIKVSTTNISSPTSAEKAKLKEVQTLLKEGKKFGDVAKQYSDDTTTAKALGSLGVVDKKTSSLSDLYGADVSTAALSLTQGKTSSAIKGTDGYYIIHNDSTNKETIKNKLKTVDVNSPLITYDNYMVYLAFKTYKINYKDSDMKKVIENVINENIKKRTEERKA